MGTQSVTLGLLVLALAASATAAPLPSDPTSANASAPNSASPTRTAPAQSNASIAGKARPTPVQLDQPGAIAVASPNQRNTGTTFASPDPALFGRLNLPAPGKSTDEPPVMQVAPADAAKRGATGNAVAPAPVAN